MELWKNMLILTDANQETARDPDSEARGQIFTTTMEKNQIIG